MKKLDRFWAIGLFLQRMLKNLDVTQIKELIEVGKDKLVYFNEELTTKTLHNNYLEKL